MMMNDAFHDNFKYKGNDNGVYAVYSGYSINIEHLNGLQEH